MVPLKTLRSVVAERRFMLKTVVRYTCRLDKVPIAPSFSKVSFPVTIIIYAKNRTKKNSEEICRDGGELKK